MVSSLLCVILARAEQSEAHSCGHVAPRPDEVNNYWLGKRSDQSLNLFTLVLTELSRVNVNLTLTSLSTKA